MANRLSHIITRTGDDGSTGLGDGTRTRKDSARIHALGDVDELNSCIGVVLAEAVPEPVRTMLTRIQNDLFDLGGELAVPGLRLIGEAHVQRLENDLARLNADLPSLKEFILPGGARAAALAHQARTIARRAERMLVALSVQDEDVNILARQFLNRASDVLFVMARWLNRDSGVSDVMWSRDPA